MFIIKETESINNVNYELELLFKFVTFYFSRNLLWTLLIKGIHTVRVFLVAQ